ncbi:MAG TPA: ATP-binding cassette domain-containing protein [Roseiarcus sp.]|nr:ATP-binding cassette domain-containing protein [Roseiarcus sp.]
MTPTRQAIVDDTAPVRPAIAAERLTRAFGDRVVVRDVSFAVRPGEIFGLIGPNGAGKSTLVKMLTTMLPPTSGRARIDGLDIVDDAQEVRGRIGYVPQLLSADGALTAYENLLLSARLYLIPRREREARIDAALREMELDDAKDRLVQTYSGGMIRRLEIAQSMLHNPAVMFMDEPTVGLDPVARHGVWDRVRSLRERLGMTILLTTHLMDEADVLCDRIGVLHAGVLEAVGTPAELKARVGPQATLDDVFAAIAGGQIADEGSFRSVREGRRAERARG